MATPTNTTGLQEEENLVEDTTQITEAQAQAMADEKNLTGQERQSYIESLFGINASATEQADTGTQESDEDTAIERPIIDGTETTTADSTTGDGTTGATVTQADIDALQPPSLEEIRQQQIDRAQSLIDATESLFAADIANLQEQGEEALAQTSSIFTSANLAGTPFKLTAETQTQEATQEAVEARRAERAAEIASIMAQAEGRADDLYQQQIENFRAEREFLVSERDKANAEAAARAEAAKTAAVSAIENMANANISLTEMDKEQYQKLLSDANISDFEAKALWAANTPAANAQYSVENGQLVGVYFDPNTQKPVVSTTSLPLSLQAGENVSPQFEQIGDSIYWYDENNPQFDAAGNLIMSPTTAGLGTEAEPDTEEGDEDEVDPTRVAAQFDLVDKAIENAKNLVHASGRSQIRETAARLLFGNTDQTALETYADTIKTSLLTMAGDPNIRDFFGPQMSEADVRMMTAGGTTLDPKKQSPAQFLEELERVEDLVSRLQSAASETSSTSQDLQSAWDEAGLEGSLEDAINTYGEDKVREVLGIPLSSSQPFSSDLNTSVNGSGASNILSLGKITGYGSPYWKEGLDIDLQIGDPVPSVGGGQVIFAGRNGGFGNQVKVRTPNGNEIWYSHLDSINVGVGDTVSDGQVVGAGGNTGSVIPGKGGDGSHLDLTVQKPDGSFYDPREIEQLLKQYA